MKKYIQTATPYVLGTLGTFFLLTVPLAYAAGGCDSGTGLKNPLTNICSLEDFVALLLQAVVRIGLPIAVLFIAYSGFLFITAQGNTTKLAQAKETFLWTVVGVAIFLGAWAIALIVKNTIVLIAG
ncbi:MAG: hypothetical protein WD509_02635 [Candidatus Paceibacterota bacterium]